MFAESLLEIYVLAPSHCKRYLISVGFVVYGYVIWNAYEFVTTLLCFGVVGKGVYTLPTFRGAKVPLILVVYRNKNYFKSF
jgi:hypothetical protein